MFTGWGLSGAPGLEGWLSGGHLHAFHTEREDQGLVSPDS